MEEQKEEFKLKREDLDHIMRGERPEGMDFEEFKVHRRVLKRLLKQHFKGRMFFMSKDISIGSPGMTYNKKEFIE
jgi:hypothetical protein